MRTREAWCIAIRIAFRTAVIANGIMPKFLTVGRYLGQATVGIPTFPQAQRSSRQKVDVALILE